MFQCEPVRGPLICCGEAWAGCLCWRYSLRQAAGTSLAALPAVLWVAAHDSRPASYPANVACNSLDTVSHRATISLGLQRLRTLLKIHSIELHAKLLQARAACVPRRARGPAHSHVGPTPRMWVRWHARGRRPGAYLGVGVRVMGLTRIVSGSRARDTPGQAPLCSQRRPSLTRHPVVGVCYRGGLRLGRHAAPRRDLTASKRGELRYTGTRA